VKLYGKKRNNHGEHKEDTEFHREK